LLKYLMVGVGGFAGAIARFWLGACVGDRLGTRFPYGTFVINISGSFLVGLTLTLLAAKARLGPHWRYLVPIGFIGAYTTFSAFEFETLSAMQDGQFLIASLNVVLSVAAGFLAVWAGVIAGRAVS
jgi:fluoride exporter